mmetsp:Transcript_20225/g.56368  ORF Transcript_20225/g.56368 Transcript_20225/m.56368 type:complete len:147 (-) Transcript_20225:63-503(-)
MNEHLANTTRSNPTVNSWFAHALQVHFSGKKWKNKLYRWHTGYPGGLKQRTAQEQLNRKPDAILRSAVLGMLKRNRLRHQCMEKRLKLYVGPEHPHTSQLPSESTKVSPALPRSGPMERFGLESYTQLPHPHALNKKFSLKDLKGL